MFYESLWRQCHYNCVTWRELVQSEFYEGLHSGCGQLGTISNGRWCVWGLAPLSQPFEHEGCSYAPKHGECHEPWQKKVIPHSRCFTKHTLKVNNIGWHFWTRVEASNQNFVNCAFRHVGPHENHNHGRCKIFRDFHWQILKKYVVMTNTNC